MAERGWASVTAIGLAVLSAEGAAYATWRLVDGPDKLAVYQQEQASVPGYRYVDSLGLVMPEPGREFVWQQFEFVERCRTSAVPGLEAGLFDDGLDAGRPVIALALGDSMTRGFGSTDCLRLGWVERLEAAFPWLDVVNLSVLAAGQHQAFLVYDRLAPRLPHDWVLISVFSGNDFLDDTEPFDWNVALGALPAGEDPTAALRHAKAAVLYRPSDEWLMARPVRSYAAWLLLRIVEKVAMRPLLPRWVREGRAIEDRLAAGAADPRIPEALRRLGAAQRASARTVQAGNMWFTLYDYQGRPDDAGRLARHAAGLINAFGERLRAAGVRAAVVLQPSKEEIYLPAGLSASLGLALDAPLDALRAALATGLPVCDLRGPLRAQAGAGGPPLYYARDGHYTPAGYEAAAEAIGACVERLMGRGSR